MTAKQKDILNKLLDYIPGLRKGQVSAHDGGDVKIGDLIADAATVAGTEIDLANGKVLIGQSTGKAAAKTLSGDAAVAATTGVVTVANSAVIGKVLTGYVSGAGVLAATDNILQGFNKLNGNVAAKAAKPTAVTALGVTSNLVGVDGTASNAAPLVGTESRLDAIEAKLDALIAALNA